MNAHGLAYNLTKSEKKKRKSGLQVYLLKYNKNLV